MNIKITDSIQYIGIDDKDLGLFESQFKVPQGVSYNSYVILDEKIAVMDTVDKRGMKEWEKNLLAVLDGKKPDYLVIHHLEPDHAGSIARFVELFPEAILVGNMKTFHMMPQFFTFDIDGRKLVVKEGDKLSLGEHTLSFVMATMVHWPEVMMSYDSRDKVLFSADAFGKFGALELTQGEDWVREGRRYYFNIIGKYGYAVQSLLGKLAPFDLKYICPLHGPVLDENLKYYIELYNIWSSYEPEEEGVLIAHASIHGNTAGAAVMLGEMLRARGVKNVVVRDLARDDMSEAVEDAFRYDRMVVAASSYDCGVFPCMKTFLHLLQSKTYKKRKVAIIENGSWSPSAGRVMREALEPLKDVEIIDPMITIHSTVKEEDIEQLSILADKLASLNK